MAPKEDRPRNKKGQYARTRERAPSPPDAPANVDSDEGSQWSDIASSQLQESTNSGNNSPAIESISSWPSSFTSSLPNSLPSTPARAYTPIPRVASPDRFAFPGSSTTVDLSFLPRPKPPPPLQPARVRTNRLPSGILPPPPAKPSAQPAAPTPSITPATIPSMANTEPVRYFRGDGEDVTENSEDFFRYLRRTLRQTAFKTDEDKINAVEDYLKSGSRADCWFTSLKSPQNTDWVEFTKAWKEEWPPVQTATRTKQELEQALIECKFDEDTLGEMAKVGGQDVWTHIAWADKIFAIAREANITTTDTCIWQVRAALPDALKDKVKSTVATWKDFIAEVKSIDLQYIKDRAARRKRDKAERDELVQRIEALSLSLRQQPPAPQAATRTPAYTPSPNRIQPQRAFRQGETTAYQRQVVNTSPGAGSNTSNRPPMTPERREALRARLNLLPHHENTDAGQAAYRAQVAQWVAKHGKDMRVMEETPFPLRPGTATICSNECFRCGAHDHFGRNCPIIDPNDPLLLDLREGSWRAICAKELGSFRRNTATRVQLVAVMEDEGQGAGNDLQGNGGGSFA